jgi:eukaryotic-like serine/threonine-protein kinase
LKPFSPRPRISGIDTSLPANERYEILGRIAAGGMAEIYLARMAVRGGWRAVVLKRLTPDLQHDDEYVEMFYDEARIASMMMHPNIVEIFELGEIDGSLFISMELVHGVNLKELQDRALLLERVLPLPIVLRVASKALDALEYAHTFADETGKKLHLVHRDISPQNILITYQGDVKLLDFGVAKADGRLHHTRQGLIKGKFAFMAPEQIVSQPVDERADLFALGEVIYQLALNRHPFYAEHDAAVLALAVEAKATPPAAIDPKFPPALGAILLRALRKDPDERFPDARSMRAALESFLLDRAKPTTADGLGRLVREMFADRLALAEEARRKGDDELLVEAFRVNAKPRAAIARDPAPPPAEKRIVLGDDALASTSKLGDDELPPKACDLATDEYPAAPTAKQRIGRIRVPLDDSLDETEESHRDSVVSPEVAEALEAVTSKEGDEVKPPKTIAADKAPLGAPAPPERARARRTSSRRRGRSLRERPAPAPGVAEPTLISSGTEPAEPVVPEKVRAPRPRGKKKGPPPPPPPDISGLRLGKYILVSRLGRGSMAEVFLARQTGPEGFEKRIAVKRIRPDLASEPEFVERFIREARLAARLSHPNVVQTLDLGLDNGQYYLAMEYVEGWDLQKILDRCRAQQVYMPVSIACRIMSDVLSGLSAAHTSTDDFGNLVPILHRDVAPQNVMVSSRGTVKLTDFGIAHAGDVTTISYEVRGKPAYSAPERIAGKRIQVDARADIFSAGVVLYEAIVLRAMFARDNALDTMLAVLRDSTPSMASLRPDTPKALEGIVARAAAKLPQDRYPDAHQMELELERFLTKQREPVTSAHVATWLARLFGKNVPGDISTEADLLLAEDPDRTGALQPVSGTPHPKLT